MNYTLLQKQEPKFRTTKLLNQYPCTKAQPSDEIQPLDNYENSTVVFDMLLSKQESNIGLFFTRRRHKYLIYTINVKTIFTYQKIQFVIFVKR